MMSRYLEGEIGNKKLSSIGAYWQHSLLPLEGALAPVMNTIDGLERSIRVAKRDCRFPSEHQLTKDESAAIFLYTMEGGDNSFYRVLNEALRSENRRPLRLWFGFLKLFDTALSKLPTVRESVWRGISGDISQQCKTDETFIWWSISSCSRELQVVQDFLGSKKNATLLMIETKNAKDITGYTSFPDEKEVLLGPATQLRVKGGTMRHGALHIVHLVEIHDGDDGPLAAGVDSVKLSSKPKHTGTRQVASTSPSSTPIVKKAPRSNRRHEDSQQASGTDHYICQHRSCDNRCHGNCRGPCVNGTDMVRGGADIIDVKCDKCGRYGYLLYFKCRKCSHTFCRNCCFKKM